MKQCDEVKELPATPVLKRWRFVDNAISYRIPQAVTKIIQYHDGNCYPVCPRCYKSMDREYMSYCDRCGQRLGWRHFERAEVCYPKIRK